MNRKSQLRHEASAVRIVRRAGSCTSRSRFGVSSNGFDMAVRVQRAPQQQVIADANNDQTQTDQLIEQDLAERNGDTEDAQGRKGEGHSRDGHVVDAKRAASVADVREPAADHDRRQRERRLEGALNPDGRDERRTERGGDQRRPDIASRFERSESLLVFLPEDEGECDRDSHQSDEPVRGAPSRGAGNPMELAVAPGGGQQEGNTQWRDAKSLEMRVAVDHVAEALKVVHVVLLVVCDGMSRTGLYQ